MATINTKNETTTSTIDISKSQDKHTYLFGKQNYMMMLIGIGVIILGYILMSGGKSADPNVFNESEIYSTVRITIAPIIVLLGLAIEGYAIMLKPKS